jgi:hypothetical protein
MHAATAPALQPRQANAPVRALAPRDAAGVPHPQRLSARVLQAGRAPAQLSLVLQPPSTRR